MIETIIFKDLYATLIDNVAGIKGEKCAFFAQVGENYQKKIMVIGRACNGYITSSLNIHTLFGTSEEAIVNRNDQMKWVADCAGNKDGYNTNKSAFWRVTKRIAQKFYPNDWYSYIAWSNVCKITHGRVVTQIMHSIMLSLKVAKKYSKKKSDNYHQNLLLCLQAKIGLKISSCI